MKSKIGLSGIFLATTILGAGCSAAVDSPTSEDDSALKSCASGTTVQGVDVSSYQNHVDWHAVKSSGRAFAIARVSDGQHHLDSQFATNWHGIKAAGLVRGVYQFFRPSQDPIAQADLLLSHVGTLGDGDLPPIVDVEVRENVSTATLRTRLKSWLSHVEAKTGRLPIIYTMASMSSAFGSDFSHYPLWIANFGASCPTMPSGWHTWQIFQKSDSGHVSGISGKVDLDVFNGSRSDLLALASGGATGADTPTDNPDDPGAADDAGAPVDDPSADGSAADAGSGAACVDPAQSPSAGHHHAGADCLGCHQGMPSASWTIAGTLYAGAAGGSPVSGATIVIDDANGAEIRLTTCDNGNFYTDQSVAFPVTVRASSCPSNVAMQQSATSGGCNGSSCHGDGNRIHL